MCISVLLVDLLAGQLMPQGSLEDLQGLGRPGAVSVLGHFVGVPSHWSGVLIVRRRRPRMHEPTSWYTYNAARGGYA